MDEVIKKFATEIKKLSPHLQEFILRGDWEDKLVAIGTRYGLSADQIYDLKIEVALVLVGLESPADFEQNVRQAMPTSQIGQTITAIKQEIFGGINDELTNLNSQLDAQDKMFDEKYKTLPLNVQQAISSVDNERAIQEIGKKYGLHIDQLGLLDDEVNLVLLGNTPSGQFVERIKNALRIDQTKAQAVGQEISEKIFLPLRDSLRALSQAPSIVEQKLSGSFSLPVEKKVDPYLEPLE